jgi:hypothetical protein
VFPTGQFFSHITQKGPSKNVSGRTNLQQNFGRIFPEMAEKGSNIENFCILYFSHMQHKKTRNFHRIFYSAAEFLGHIAGKFWKELATLLFYALMDITNGDLTKPAPTISTHSFHNLTLLITYSVFHVIKDSRTLQSRPSVLANEKTGTILVNHRLGKLIKKKRKFSSYIRKFRWDRVQSHI